MKDEWISRIHKMLLKEDVQFNTEKDKCLPRYLAKYRSINEYSINSLKNDTVWFDKPSNYNDPYDCSITITGELIRNYINQNIEKLESNIGSNFDSKQKVELYDFQFSGLIDEFNGYIQNSCLISCFSAKSDSLLMWSHYSDSHKGFCLVYDISKVDTNSMIRKNLYPVNYVQNKFDLACYLDDALSPEYPCVASLCWKNMEWSYENEYRIVLPCEAEDCHPKLYDFIKPVYILLGSKMDKEDKDRIENIALDREIKILHMSCNAQRYALDSCELLWKRRE